jgi:hypothetical protein
MPICAVDDNFFEWLHNEIASAELISAAAYEKLYRRVGGNIFTENRSPEGVNWNKVVCVTRSCVALSLGSLPILGTPQDVKAKRAIVVGVNIVNPLRAKIADQDVLLQQLKEANVLVVRCGIDISAKGIDFAKRVYAQGIAIQLIVGPQYPPEAPKRAYQPVEYPGMWSGHPLSYADPALSRKYFQTLMDRLEASGIVLAGLELGNEINWAAFNQEFPLPGEGKIFTLDDLYRDPEAIQIAKGFVQYLRVAAELKAVRDQSRLNRNTPIICAGLVTAVDGAPLYNHKKEDMVGLSATLKFMRANGLDSLVDAYGIHEYPSSTRPGDPTADAKRADHFFKVALAECRPPGSPQGKPAWLTEWGFPNSDFSCPPNDSKRAMLIRQMRTLFAKAAGQGRLVGATVFSWDADPWSKSPDKDSLFRYGILTEAGREAVAPLSPSQ